VSPADYHGLSLTELARALRTGALSAVAIAEAAAARRASGRHLGAYVHQDAPKSLRHAAAADASFKAAVDHGPLQGLPVSVKDLYGVPGWPTRAGSPAVLPAAYAEAGPLVARLLQGLAVPAGKTHTVEFAFGGLGTNPHHPVPRNPWDAATHRVPGGSSAGAGVSLHCDAVLALGTDTAGSVRIPAAMTGTVGLKTTHGRWPLAGIVPLSPSFDTPGLLARSAADALLAFHALDDSGGGPPATLPAVAGLRLGRCDDELWEGCSAGVVEAVEAALATLSRAGARLERVDLPVIEPALALFRRGHLAAAELQEFLSTCLPERLETLDPAVRARMDDAGEMKAGEYLRRRRELARLQAQADTALAGFDALVMPAVANTAPRLEAVAELDAYRPQNLLALRNTSIANLLRLCAITLPVGLDAAGIPVGLQLVMRAGEDARLAALAAALECVLASPAERLGKAPLAP